jgi:hypothetical protein
MTTSPCSHGVPQDWLRQTNELDMQTLLAVTGAKPTACAARVPKISVFTVNPARNLFTS